MNWISLDAPENGLSALALYEYFIIIIIIIIIDVVVIIII